MGSTIPTAEVMKKWASVVSDLKAMLTTPSWLQIATTWIKQGDIG
jgi:hypothetical protein